MKIVVKTIMAISFMAILTVVGSAQTASQPKLDDLQKRIVELETQLKQP